MQSKVSYFNPPSVAKPAGAYAHVARVKPGELAFIAGQVAVDEQGAIVGVDDFSTQFDAVYRQLGRILADLGSGFDDVAEFTTYLTRESDLPAYRAARDALYPQLFSGPLYPPNTLLFIDALVRREFLIEVSATARIGE